MIKSGYGSMTIGTIVTLFGFNLFQQDPHAQGQIWEIPTTLFIMGIGLLQLCCGLLISMINSLKSEGGIRTWLIPFGAFGVTVSGFFFIALIMLPLLTYVLTSGNLHFAGKLYVGWFAMEPMPDLVSMLGFQIALAVLLGTAFWHSCKMFVGRHKLQGALA